MNKLSKKLKSSKGFSLVELVIVIGIIAVLVAVVGAFIIRYIEKSKIQKDVANGSALASAAVAAANEPEVYRELTHAIAVGNTQTTMVSPGLNWSSGYTDLFTTTVARNYGKMPDFEYKKTTPSSWLIQVTNMGERLDVKVSIVTASGTFQVAPKPEGPYAN